MPIIHPKGAAGSIISAVPIDFSFTDWDGSAAIQQLYSFPTKLIGAEDDNRSIVISAIGRGNVGASRTITEILVGGNAATEHLFAESDGIGSHAAICVADVPLGADALVTVEWSDTMQNCGIALYRMVGHGSNVPSHTDVATITNAQLDTNINIVDGGAVASTAFWTAGSGLKPSIAWTGLTERVDEDFGVGALWGSAGEGFATGETGRLVRAVTDATGSIETVMATAAWSP